MRGIKPNLLSRALTISSLVCLSGLLLLMGSANTSAQTQRAKTKAAHAETETTKPGHFKEYRGVRLGMTTDEARAKLGEPTLKGDDQDFYIFPTNESAQIAYNAAHKVVTISADYPGGVGAPDYKAVVGEELERKPDGSMYKMVNFERDGYWVSYNKSSGVTPVVTITLQARWK